MFKASFLGIVFSTVVFAGNDGMLTFGKPTIQSMSVLEFSPAGVLFIGDSKAGQIVAIQLDEVKQPSPESAPTIPDLERKIAAMMGAKAEDIMIHDMAVSPVSYDVYLAVSRGRSRWTGSWTLPNDVDDAKMLVRVNANGAIQDVSLDNVKYAVMPIPDPVAANKEHPWKKNVSMRTEAITALQFHEGKLFVAGMSNEEFSAAIWIMPYPFEKTISVTTVEIYHGAHGQYETNSPIRALTFFGSGDDAEVLAAYLCTPLVIFKASDLKNAKHVKGKTVAEFGSGNYPVDMIPYENQGRQLVAMNNTNLPLILFDPKDADQQESITQEVLGYTAGLPHTKRSGTGILQMDNFNQKFLLALQRMPGGSLDLQPILIERLQL